MRTRRDIEVTVMKPAVTDITFINKKISCYHTEGNTYIYGISDKNSLKSMSVKHTDTYYRCSGVPATYN